MKLGACPVNSLGDFLFMSCLLGAVHSEGSFIRWLITKLKNIFTLLFELPFGYS